jgi:hypothetical protein
MATNSEQSGADRRSFLKQIVAVTGGVALAPVVVACTGGTQGGKTTGGTLGKKAGKVADGLGKGGPLTTSVPVPKTKPAVWDALAFNKARGNAGAIPKSYLPSINGPDGEKKHLGKHLPYQPTIDAKSVPTGHIAVMWGDPQKGYAPHPNARKDAAKNYPGHWYNWVRIRKAVDGDAQEKESTFADWPGTGEEAKKYVAFSGTDVTAASGKGTVYLVALPADVKKGDTVRVWAHCLTHGEYVDFITI